MSTNMPMFDSMIVEMTYDIFINWYRLSIETG